MSHQQPPAGSDLATVRAEDAAAARFIGITLTVLFVYSVIVMAGVAWWTVLAVG
jgi:hypothetical protein